MDADERRRHEEKAAKVRQANTIAALAELRKTNMTVDDLRAAMAELPGDMLVGNVGHFGEILELGKSDFHVGKAVPVHPFTQNRKDRHVDPVDILVLEIEDAGPDPD